MQNQTLRSIIIAAVVVVLLVGSFSGGILVGWLLPDNLSLTGQKATITPAQSINGAEGGTPANLQTTFKPFWEAWQIVHDQYIEQPVDDLAMMRGAIRGALDALGDEHTGYMDPSQYTQSAISMDGEYSGIGAWVDSTGEYLTILSPMPDSPAEKAGLKPLDQVIKIDGQDMTGISGDKVIERVLGPAGTKVVLTIRRKDVSDLFDVEVIRDKINVPSVQSRMLDGKIGYVRIYTFGEKSAQELDAALQNVLKDNPVALIVDLRNNGGGYLTSAVDLTSQFLDVSAGQSVVLNEEYGNGKTDVYSVKDGGIATKLPLMVLVNKFSASASEIMAGAIQDYGRGKLLGETTYGKGSVQNWIELEDQQGAIRVTIAHWLTPSGRQINKVGLKPDIEVAMTDEDALAGRDPQLEQAVKVLLGQ